MRRRLINSTLAVVLVVIAVFGVSLVIVETRTISNSAQESVDSEAVRLVSIVDSRLLGGEQVTPEILREQITAGPLRRDRDPGRAADRDRQAARRATSSSPQERGEQGETVTVEESRSVGQRARSAARC